MEDIEMEDIEMEDIEMEDIEMEDIEITYAMSLQACCAETQSLAKLVN